MLCNLKHYGENWSCEVENWNCEFEFLPIIHELWLGFIHTDRRMNYHAVAATAGTSAGTSSGSSLEIRKISLDWDEVERTKK